jgi:pyruvate dehydrogenase E2 component (dihydrolipoamide acetyltransferase)
MSSSTFAEEHRVVRAVPLARWMAVKKGIDLSLVKGSGPKGIILPKDIETFKTTQRATGDTPDTKKKVSSLARRLAEKKGIVLEKIEGTGTRGRIMMADILRVHGKGGTLADGKAVLGRTLPMSQMRKVIANRMSQSAFTAPHIYFFSDVEMDALEKLREKVLPEFERKFNIRVSINDFLIKAVGLTLREFPILNAVVKDEEIVIMPEINIGLAVALEEGLIVPAIPQADRLSLGDTARIRADLVERAKSRRLKLEEIERGTFTISSLAQFDITFFTAILNPPQSGILTVGKTADHLALKGGKILSKKVAHFGLSVDHRIIDGVLAATFMQSLKEKLEKATLMSF